MSLAKLKAQSEASRQYIFNLYFQREASLRAFLFSAQLFVTNFKRTTNWLLNPQGLMNCQKQLWRKTVTSKRTEAEWAASEREKHTFFRQVIVDARYAPVDLYSLNIRVVLGDVESWRRLRLGHTRICRRLGCLRCFARIRPATLKVQPRCRFGDCIIAKNWG